MLINAETSVKFELIKETSSRELNLICIKELCRIAGVSKSGYYSWLRSQKKRDSREEKDKQDFALIEAAYKYKGYDKGMRGIHMRLLRRNPPVVMNVKKIGRLMKKFNLRCPIRAGNPYRKMSKAKIESRIVPNILNRKFRTGGARRVLLTDITYLPRFTSYSESTRYSYLAVIMDAFTKEVLAYVLSISCETDMVLEMLEQLAERHGDELKTDALVHNDQGCQYMSHKFAELLQDYDLRQSMSRKGNCWDNAPQESLFGHMKDEVTINPSDTHPKICKKIDDWMEYYNNDRPQWNLDKLTPVEYYRYVTTGIYPLPNRPEAVIEREKRLGDKTVEDFIAEEEIRIFGIKAETRKLNKMAESGITPLPESNEADSETFQ